MKNLAKIILFCSLVVSFVLAQDDELTGDKKLACEAILCLSSGEKPHECDKALKRYYSIHYKKPNKTLKARKNFLKLCPKDNSDDEVSNYIDNTLANAGECTEDALNKRLQRQSKQKSEGRGKIWYYRVNPNLPQACLDLMNSKYSYGINFKYTCTGQWYSFSTWNNAKKDCWVVNK